MQEQNRHVLIPTRGEGRCPHEDSAARFGKRQCNVQPCQGDEICIAQQDVILAIDGSGSLDPEGFKILLNFAKELVVKYEFRYRGQDAIKMGVVQFGNGEIEADGKTVTPAKSIMPLSTDKKQIQAALAGVQYLKGFTNMAQGFAMAEDMFTKGGRSSASQGVLMITDGKPSFIWMTNEMVEQLDDKNIMRYFVVVNDEGPASDVMLQIRKWAQFPLGKGPWENNLIHVQGLAMLDADVNLWTQAALTKFCPMSYSPSKGKSTEVVVGFMHVKDSGWCGNQGAVLSKTASDAAACAALATGAGVKVFTLGVFFRRGYCQAGDMVPTTEEFAGWQKDRVNPLCKTTWRSSMLFDFYAIAPLTKR